MGKLGESGLPGALKFMSNMFDPVAETSPKDITNRGRWWETAWKRKQAGRDECMNIPEAQKFSHMASLLVHEVYMLDDATWCAISGVDVGSKESRGEQLLFLFGEVVELHKEAERVQLQLHARQGLKDWLMKDANAAWVKQGKKAKAWWW